MNSQSTTAKEIFSTKVVVIMINLGNPPCSEASQNHPEQGWAGTGLEGWEIRNCEPGETNVLKKISSSVLDF